MTSIAFDSDVIIFSANPHHAAGARVAALFGDPALDGRRFGSTLLLPETLIKPVRYEIQEERETLLGNVAYLELIAPDVRVAMLAVQLGARYALRTPDAVHLATAVHAGADAFLTNNRKDFPSDIAEIRILHPENL